MDIVYFFYHVKFDVIEFNINLYSFENLTTHKKKTKGQNKIIFVVY
jgi:hypothetical protein